MGDERLIPCSFALHPAPTLPGARQLEWFPSLGVAIRGAERTCSRCRRISYEYGVIGGAYRIRRTNHQQREVRETPAVPRLEAAVWWQELITGRAV